ncbi:MAG: valine--tRNA ligase [Bacillota bacterium]|nr:valine--tRNA ligase [Bacillota bacterium]
MLSKKYDPQEAEKRWQDYWKQNKIYKFDGGSGKEVYSIDTPPPTVSGSLHIGHIFSYTQAEMIARFHRMQGREVFYPFGFDDNGLPTERLVEREKGIRAANQERKDFVNSCLDITRKYEAEFRELWMSMGFSVDWDLQYETISPRVQRISQKSFIKLAKAGRAYIKESPVLWCTNCRTSIAQAELESTDIETSFNYVTFRCEGEELIIATTRPELLYGCVCLFANPEDERYKKYIGRSARVPLYDYDIPILADEKAAIDKGTGIVMCATFGDTTDVEWYEKHNLPYRKVIEENGFIDGQVPFIGELKVEEARRQIIALLDEKGLLKKSECLAHTVSIHERCGKPIEIIPSKQWYIDILKHKEELLSAGDRINWYPSSMKARYTSWVENLKWDWCISRQRYFGIPFPVWYCSDCGNIIFADEEELPINPMEGSSGKQCKCGCRELIPEKAVMDTWATSSLTPLINGHWGEAGDMTDKLIPMSMRTQAHEIIRTWTFYTIAKTLFHTGRLPWKDIMICGYVLAKKGEKISKSKNNGAFDPKTLIARNSADALRYWAAGARLGTDTMFSEEDLKLSSRFMTKLWNAAKFSLMHLQDYKKEQPAALMPIDRWILEAFENAQSKAREYLDSYEVGLALQEIDAFFWKEFCDNYLEIVKDRLYKPEVHGIEERRSAQYALYKILLGILKLYAIYVPHITEEIYQDFYKAFEEESSIHRMKWEQQETGDPEAIHFGEACKSILGEIRKYKTERNMSMKEPVNKLTIQAEEKLIKKLEATIKDLKGCTSAGSIEIKAGGELIVQIE